jgi:predicted CXXCH cytochrome family protein
MRKTLVWIGLALLAAVPASAQITSTAHDLSAAEGNGQICIFCHTPHNAAPAVPLWNHTLSTSTFTAYDSPTMDATDNNNWTGGDGNVSALCMSCHDGSVGLGSLINEGPGGTPTNSATNISGAALLGTDLSNDHPVAFTYNAALQTADGELVDPTTLTGAVLLFGAGSDQVECASCHDPHNNTNPPFLVTSNTGSALCLTCHVK